MSFEQHKRVAVRKARKLYEERERAIEVILEHPEKSRKDQAALMGVSSDVFSRILSDPEFETMRTERVAQIIDPALRQQLERGLLAVTMKAVRVVDERLDIEPTLHDALATVKVASTALGMANRKETPVVQNNIQIAWLPPQG